MRNNEIFVWNINWIDYLNQKDIFYPLLSCQEKARVKRYRFERHQNQFIITRAILRILIGELLQQDPNNLIFEYTDLGQPRLACSEELYFSVSYSQHKVLYAFCKHPNIGIDIEYQRDLNIDWIAARYFSNKENQALKLLNPLQKQAAFFRGWTQKEAITKALGLGLNFPFDQIEVALTCDFPRIITLPLQLHHSDYWYFNAIKTNENFKAVVAARTVHIALCCTQFTQINIPTY